MAHGMREVEIRVKGPGSGRESAIRALQAIGLEITVDQGRDAGSAQRLPSAQKTPRLNFNNLKLTNFMARYTGPRVRISRRFGMPIFGPDEISGTPQLRSRRPRPEVPPQDTPITASA